MDIVTRTISALHRQNEAEAAFRCRNFVEAERIYRFELASLETLQGSSYIDVAVTLHNLSLVLEAQAKYDEAAKMRNRMSQTLTELKTPSREEHGSDYYQSLQSKQCS